MNDRDIDEILNRAAANTPAVDPALLAGVAQSLRAPIQPVRPLAPTWILAGGLVFICATVAVAAAMLLKPFGFLKMDALEIAVIFSLLAALVCAVALGSVAEIVPGSRRPMAPWLLSVCACLALAAAFVFLFRDYGVENFLPRGVACLTAGVAVALPAFVAIWLLLGRGFPVNPFAAGLAKGSLAGLAGVAMLELHCPLFEVPHLLVWHLAVLPVCGLAGAVFSIVRVRSRPGE